MSKIEIFILVSIIAIAALVGFALWYNYDHKVYSGVVIDKRFTAAHTTTIMVSNQIGKTTVMMPQIIHYPDKWEVQIEGRDRKERKGYTWWEVGKVRYDEFKIDDRAKFD